LIAFTIKAHRYLESKSAIMKENRAIIDFEDENSIVTSKMKTVTVCTVIFVSFDFFHERVHVVLQKLWGMVNRK